MKPLSILVTGATGKTGSRVLSRLKTKGHDARPGSRKAQVPFDWDDAGTWEKALSGMSIVYVSYQPDFAFPVPSRN